MEKVSIVIPTFNQAEYFWACFDSCYFQTYPNLEIVVVDGGSTDETKTLLASMKSEMETRATEPILRMNSRGEIIRRKCLTYLADTHAEHPQRQIRILSFEEDLGRTGTYNAGFAEVSGDFCTYVVGDDLPHPHMIEELMAAVHSSGADVVYSDFNIVDNNGRVVRLVRKPDYSFRACFVEWFHLGVSRLHRTALHETVGLMDPSYQVANDYEFYLRMAMAGASFLHVPKVLYSVRYHGFETQHDESRKCSQRARAWLRERSEIPCHRK